MAIPKGIDALIRDTTTPAPVRPVRCGDRVIYLNRFSHPRPADVTGTHRSLRGEQHVPLIDAVDALTVVHLAVLSPLRGIYVEHHVAHIDAAHGLLTEVWAWPDDPRIIDLL